MSRKADALRLLRKLRCTRHADALEARLASSVCTVRVIVHVSYLTCNLELCCVKQEAASWPDLQLEPTRWATQACSIPTGGVRKRQQQRSEQEKVAKALLLAQALAEREFALVRRAVRVRHPSAHAASRLGYRASVDAKGGRIVLRDRMRAELVEVPSSHIGRALVSECVVVRLPDGRSAQLGASRGRLASLTMGNLLEWLVVALGLESEEHLLKVNRH